MSTVLHATPSPTAPLPNSITDASNQWQLGTMGEWWHKVVVSKRLAHGWILRCPNTQHSYALGLVLAKVLNCQQPPKPGIACNACRNCRWINDNAHPAVITLSPRTLLVHESTNDWPKLLRQKTPKFQKGIHATQIEALESQLAYRSDDTRVVLICDGDITSAENGSNKAVAPPPHELNDVIGSEGNLPGHQFIPLPITMPAMAASPTNKLLKTLEEPPPKCIFLFLTTHEDQLLDTIVSRCQTLPLNSNVEKSSGTLSEDVTDLLTQWVNGGLGSRDNVDDHWHKLQDTVDSPANWESILLAWENLLHQYYRSSTNINFNLYHQQLTAIETCRKQINAYVPAETALKHLLFNLCHEMG